jgi:uncharacterized protein YbbK (DUF523 family)
MIVVSACLAGINCNYKASNKENQNITKLVSQGKAIPICPEQLGGLPTPRKPAEIKENRVVTIDNQDVTEAFEKGAREVLKICQKHNCTTAILKSKSPSCGCNLIYNGEFNNTLISGDGITTKLLKQNSIKVISSDDF